MYCNGFIPITPVKETEGSAASSSNTSAECLKQSAPNSSTECLGNNPELSVLEAEKVLGSIGDAQSSSSAWPQIEPKD